MTGARTRTASVRKREPNTYQVDVEFNAAALFVSTVFTDAYGETETIAEQVVKLQDEGVIEALVALGWTPPDGARTTVSSHDAEEAFRHFLAYTGYSDKGVFSLHSLHVAYLHAWNRQRGPDECACPQHGRWISADDILRSVKELDVAMNGVDAATGPKLIDVLPQVLEHIRIARMVQPQHQRVGDMRLAPALLLQTVIDYAELKKPFEKWMMALLAVALNPEPYKVHGTPRRG